jgi:transcriptional regulator with XRE-family HTH domain
MLARKPSLQIHNLRCRQVGEAIKQCRIALDLSVQDLAKRIGRSASQVQDIEEARVAVDSELLQSCASVFGLTEIEIVSLAASDSTLLVAEECGSDSCK